MIRILALVLLLLASPALATEVSPRRLGPPPNEFYFAVAREEVLGEAC